MGTQTKLEKFLVERNAARNAWSKLNLGENDDLRHMATNDILVMVAELEDAQTAGKINLETEDGLETLAEIITRHERDDRTPVYYDGDCIGKVLTNRSHDINELLAMLGIDAFEQINGDWVWDNELFTQSI